MDTTPFQELLVSLTEEQVQQIVNALVIDHQNGTLDPQKALSRIAQMAALRSLPTAFERRLKQVHR